MRAQFITLSILVVCAVFQEGRAEPFESAKPSSHACAQTSCSDKMAMPSGSQRVENDILDETPSLLVTLDLAKSAELQASQCEEKLQEIEGIQQRLADPKKVESYENIETILEDVSLAGAFGESNSALLGEISDEMNRLRQSSEGGSLSATGLRAFLKFSNEKGAQLVKHRTDLLEKYKDQLGDSITPAGAAAIVEARQALSTKSYLESVGTILRLVECRRLPTNGPFGKELNQLIERLSKAKESLEKSCGAIEERLKPVRQSYEKHAK